MASARDVSLTELSFDLVPSERDDIPLEPLIRSARARMTDGALAKIVRAALEAAEGQLPVDADFIAAGFTREGATIELRVGKGRMLATNVTIELSARGDAKGAIIAEIGEIRGLGMGLEGMLSPFIDRVLEAAERPGVRRDRRRGHALVISPNEMLEDQRIPLSFDPKGRWSVSPAKGHAEASFAGRGSRDEEE